MAMDWGHCGCYVFVGTTRCFFVANVTPILFILSHQNSDLFEYVKLETLPIATDCLYLHQSGLSKFWAEIVSI